MPDFDFLYPENYSPAPGKPGSPSTWQKFPDGSPSPYNANTPPPFGHTVISPKSKNRYRWNGNVWLLDENVFSNLPGLPPPPSSGGSSPQTQTYRPPFLTQRPSPPPITEQASPPTSKSPLKYDPYGRALGKSVAPAATHLSGTGGGGNNTNVDPKPVTETPSTLPVPDDSSDVLEMPNISKKIADYTKKLEFQFLNDIKEAILGAVDFKTINYISEEKPLAELITKQFNVSKAEFNNFCNNFQYELRKGVPGDDLFDYAEYLRMFEVTYNDDSGAPEITLRASRVTGWNLEFVVSKVNQVIEQTSQQIIF